MRFFPATLGLCVVVVAGLPGPTAGAQNAAVAPAPLLRIGEDETPAVGDLVQSLAVAQQALELGFATAAREEFLRVLARPNLSAELQNRAALGLAAAEMTAGRLEEAEAALGRAASLISPGARLRRALIALLRRQLEVAAPLVEALRAEDLPEDEAGWLEVARGMLAEARGSALQDQKNAAEARAQFERAKEAYAQAEARAPSALLRAQMVLARERTRLLFGPAAPDQVKVLQGQIDQFQGRPVGFTAAGQQAVVLDLLGRKGEAQAVLQRQLPLVPAAEGEVADQLRLLLILISGADSGVGQNALRELLTNGAQPETQRIALQLLAATAGTSGARERFRHDLDALIGARPAPRLLDDLLLYRARLALAEQEHDRAEEDARTLLANFPGSPLRVPALNVVVSVAWELRRYRTATEAIMLLQGELGRDPHRGEFAVLLAEAYFRASDYRNAAGAYAQALAERTLPAGATRGTLMFQHVLALLLAGQDEQLTEAQTLLDRLAGDANFDAVNRWRAEWNLVKTFEIHGLGGRAYERLNRILADDAAASAPADLRLRLAWLQARLSLDVGEPEATLGLVDKLLAVAAVEGAAAAPEALRKEVAGTAMLLRARALLGLRREPEGLAELKKLRDTYPDSDPAVYSVIIQARFLAERGQTVDAQQLLIQLAENHKDSRYAPYALYEAASNAERRGQDEHYKEAYKILENLQQTFPQNELVFYAKLRQGDLLRKVDDLGAAQVLYESLLNDSPDHRDAPLAELALADTLFAQVSTDAARLGSARARYERLFDLPSAPVDVRIEAGFKEGNALATRGSNAEARRALWLVVSRFLLDEKLRGQVGEKGRYWLGRSLLVYAELGEKAHSPEEARNAYDLILRSGVWGEKSARAGLARLGGG